MRVMLLAGLVFVVGCDTLSDVFPDGIVQCDGKPTDIKTNPKACGDCPGWGDVCANGVACVDYWCDYTSVMHCGAPGRACIGDGEMACVLAEPGADAPLPLVGPVVNGYGCAIVASPGEVDPARVPPVDVGRPAGALGPGADDRAPTGAGLEPPSWLFVPSQSAGCRDGDPARCHQAWVDFTDVCGETCRLPFDHNFSVMTTEMSRAQYREAVCDCTFIETEQCADVCTVRGPDVDAMPMVGLNWCMAQAACEAVGGRLPTALERARVEQLLIEAHNAADGHGDLFHGASCTDWRAVSGDVPNVGECVDSGADAGLVRVDDPRGSLVVEPSMWPTPIRVHHLLGNAGEWTLDEPGAARCDDLLTEATLRVPRDWQGMRTVQGRSVMSPMGEVENRLAVVAPSARAVDLGLRCVHSAYAAPEIEAALATGNEYCEHNPHVGQEPVRQASGERIYRTVEACIGSRTGGGEVIAAMEEAFADDLTPLVWRDVDRPQIGQAWLSPDVQWWIATPARLDEQMSVEVYRGGPVWLTWSGQRTETEASRCRVEEMRSAYADQDGVIVRQLDFQLGRDQLADAFPRTANAARFACRQFACVESVEESACETSCPAWRLPVVVSMEQLEVFDHAGLCR